MLKRSRICCRVLTLSLILYKDCPLCLMILVLNPVIINGRGLPKEYREVKPDYPQAASKLLTATIISYALAEVPAFFGLVLALLTHQMKDFYILAAVSFGLILVNLPKWEEWENGIKKIIPTLKKSPLI